jgi:hypothetical protein
MPRTTAEYPAGVGKLTTKSFISIALLIETPAYFWIVREHLNLHPKDWLQK